uniref:Ribosome maturation factor RimP n=1 Tax=uncultured Helicobacter sp. TaxID=175537 RepID=A0A650EKP2_9HELI|nr:ribosome maturation factor RimP [uncultured Helicobacter sp.]
MLSENTRQKIEALAKTLGLYIYDMDFIKEDSRDIFRVSITKKAPFIYQSPSSSTSVGVQDCQNLSELISPLLDVEEVNLDRYNLEVSSPGLERSLKKPQHYQFSLGENVRIKRVDKSIIEGILESIDDQKISIKTEDETQEIPLSDIKTAKVCFEF